MSIKIDKVMSKDEFEIILKIAQIRYKGILDACDARDVFKKHNKKKLNEVKKMVGKKDKKFIFTKKMFKEMLTKADEALLKDLGDIKDISILGEFLRKFQPNSSDIPEIDLTFLTKETNES